MIVVTIHAKGARVETIEKIVKAAITQKFIDAQVTAVRKERNESRSDRFSEAQSLAGEAKSEAESLRDELQGWKDNLPENLQSGSKADELDEAVQSLEEFIEYLESAEGVDVSFPSMY